MRFKDVARALLVAGAVGAVLAAIVPRRRRQPVLIGNERSKVYHLPDCRFAPEEGDAVVFRDASAAEAAGYRPCRVCIG